MAGGRWDSSWAGRPGAFQEICEDRARIKGLSAAEVEEDIVCRRGCRSRRERESPGATTEQVVWIALSDVVPKVTREQSANRRGRPRKYPSWLDAEGQSRAFTTHPNHQVCRNFWHRAHDPHGEVFHQSGGNYNLCDRWLGDLTRFVYELSAEIGPRPGERSQIRARDESRPIGPSNVRWSEAEEPMTRAARHARDKRGDRSVPTPTRGFVLTENEVSALAHRSGCESEWLDPIECTCCDGIVQSRQRAW